MTKRDLYFWEPELSPHKFPLFDAIRRSPQFGNATYVAEAALGDSRRDQGWNSNVPEGASVIMSPDATEVDRIVSQAPTDSVHIFSGLRRVPCIVHGIRSAIRHGRHFGIFQEPRVFEGAKGYVRLAQSLLTEQHLRDHAQFILAVGRHGPSWFKMSGYRENRIFPFAYFLDPPGEGAHTRNERPRVVFLGRLEKLKGAHLFIEALDLLKSDVDIQIAGRGTLEPLVRAACAAAPKRRIYRGVLPMEQTTAFLRDADVLVLPSITKDDGWGAVVSEALMVGTAVVASDAVGSSSCLEDGRGLVITDLSPQAVAQAIDAMVMDPTKLSQGAREARALWAKTRLTADTGASYLNAIVAHRLDGAPSPPDFIAPIA